MSTFIKLLAALHKHHVDPIEEAGRTGLNKQMANNQFGTSAWQIQMLNSIILYAEWRELEIAQWKQQVGEIWAFSPPCEQV